jgi:hypothetical protein
LGVYLIGWLPNTEQTSAEPAVIPLITTNVSLMLSGHCRIGVFQSHVLFLLHFYSILRKRQNCPELSEIFFQVFFFRIPPTIAVQAL